MSNIANRIYFYGLDQEYRVIRYNYIINSEPVSIQGLKLEARMLSEDYPGVELVYVVDNCYDVYRNCWDSIRNNSVEDRVAFKDTLERLGQRFI